MEDNIPPSQEPTPVQITPEQLEQMKARARELAIQQSMVQKSMPPATQPQIIYLRRNLTVAELLLLILLSCGIVTGIQWTWNNALSLLPRIEIKVK